jgi:chitin synthase
MDPHRRCNAAGELVEPYFDIVKRRGVHPRALIVITAYDEDAALVNGTLNGVLANVSTLRALRGGGGGGDGTGGAGTPGGTSRIPDARLRAAAAALAPSDLVCLLIFDGRARMHASHLCAGGLLSGADAAARMAASARGAPARAPDDDVRDVHLFELDYAPAAARGAAAPADALRLIVAVKEANGGKLNSHAWALRGLGPFLAPDFVVMLDAGTVPAPAACLRLLGTLLCARDVGGACGEICVAAAQRSLLAPVVMAQVFEYTSANAVDKAFESTLGFIGVLPGAFSAYRCAALEGAPLEAYFLLEDRAAAARLSTLVANMYLAEDRILGFEIVAKRGARWRLAYDAGAAAHTDVPETVGQLVKQRRRWLNGSFFATVYALSLWARLMPGGGTAHAWPRQVAFAFLFLFHAVNVLLAWLTLGNTYFALRLVLDAAAPAFAGPAASGAIVQFFYCLSWAWQLLHVFLLIWSLGNKAEESLWLWSTAAVFFGLVGLCAIALVVSFIAVSSPAVWVSGVGALAVYLLCGALMGQAVPLVLSAAHYLASIPLFSILIPIYAWSNTHDLSWGTRPGGDPTAAEAAAAATRTHREFRSRMLASWIACNWILAQTLSQSAGVGSNSKASFSAPALLYYGYALAALSALSFGARVLGCLAFVAFEAAAIVVDRAGWHTEGPREDARPRATSLNLLTPHSAMIVNPAASPRKRLSTPSLRGGFTPTLTRKDGE